MLNPNDFAWMMLLDCFQGTGYDFAGRVCQGSLDHSSARSVEPGDVLAQFRRAPFFDLMRLRLLAGRVFTTRIGGLPRYERYGKSFAVSIDSRPS
jgi:hypothetical protein